MTLLAVIEHLPDSPRKLLSEIHRVLAPGGTLICDTPNSASAYKRIILVLRGYLYPPLDPYYESEILYSGQSPVCAGPRRRETPTRRTTTARMASRRGS